MVYPRLIVLVKASEIVWSSSRELKRIIGDPLGIYGNKSFKTISNFKFPSGLTLDSDVRILKR